MERSRAYTFAITLLFFAGISGASPAAAQDRGVEEEINILLSAPHGLDWPDSVVQSVLARFQANPGPYLDAIERRIEFPPPGELNTYPLFLSESNHLGLFKLLERIPDYRATRLLRESYLRTSVDSDTLFARFQRLLDRIGRPPAATPEYYELRQAHAAATMVSSGALQALGKRGVADVLVHAQERYLQAGYGGRADIERYARRVAGRFERPPQAALHIIPTANVTPLLACVAEGPGGELTAFFSYENFESTPVKIPRSSSNRLAPSEYESLQPEAFNLPSEVARRSGQLGGVPTYVFTVTFPQEDTISWTLLGRTVVASDDSPRCARR